MNSVLNNSVDRLMGEEQEEPQGKNENEELPLSDILGPPPVSREEVALRIYPTMINFVYKTLSAELCNLPQEEYEDAFPDIVAFRTFEFADAFMRMKNLDFSNLPLEKESEDALAD